MCILLKDDEIKSFNSRQDLQEYLDFRKAHDKWFESPIDLMQVFTKNPNEMINGFKERTGSIISDLAIQECVEHGTNLFLKFHTEINGQDILLSDHCWIEQELGAFLFIMRKRMPGLMFFPYRIK